MPISKFTETRHGAWAVWEITEAEQELAFLALESCPEEIVSPAKRLEFLAVRALLRLVCDRLQIRYEGTAKDEFGKPHLKPARHHISLTHSFPFVAVQLDAHQAVGIDLEQPRQNLVRVASRVFNDHERTQAGEDLTLLCILWCAKEVLYKIYGKRGIHFKTQLAINGLQNPDAGTLAGEILVNPIIRATLHYQTTPQYILATTDTVL